MKKILLIDDDREDAEIFRDALETVNPAAAFYWIDGSGEIKSIIGKTVPIPDLIFLDINLIRTTGWDWLNMLKGEPAFSSIPVVMYTTSNRAEEKERAGDLGAIAFVTKPNSYTDLETALASLVI